MYKVDLYIEGSIVEMFKDENVTMTSSVQNINDISKIFTDYSQSFTVPASDKNNLIFKHWYKPEIDGFDARERKDATIEINNLPFKEGKVSLSNVKIKDGKPSSYTLNFIGQLVKLTDLFGEDYLTDLDLSAYEHDFSSANVIDGVEGSTLLSGNVIYPLISPERVWTFGDAATTDIRYSTTTEGLHYYELKPMLRLNALISAINAKYNITLSNDFFATDAFNSLYMWASKEKGRMNATGVPQDLIFDGTTYGYAAGQQYFSIPSNLGWLQSRIELSIVPEVGYEDVEWTLIKIEDGVETTYTYKGNKFINILYDTPADQYINFKMKSSESFQFDVNIRFYYRIVSWTEIFEGDTGVTSTDGKVYFSDTLVDGVLQPGQLPKMTVKDFISSIIKMFNLVIIPTASDKFTIKPLDDWYSEGAYWDLSSCVNASSSEVNRLELNKTIDFKYKEAKTILQDQFDNNNGIQYGNLEYESSYDGNKFEIQLGFENMLFSRLSDNDGTLTNVMVGSAIDINLEPIKTEPIILYLSGNETPTSSIGILDDSATPTLQEVTTYNVCGQEDSTTTITRSLNFGSEVSTYTLLTVSASLFSNYWQSYIVDLYDVSRREFNYEAILPPIILSKLKLNDHLILNNRRYIINEMNINLTTGLVKFNLLNDLSDAPVTEITNNGLEYELEFGIEG